MFLAVRQHSGFFIRFLCFSSSDIRWLWFISESSSFVSRCARHLSRCEILLCLVSAASPDRSSTRSVLSLPGLQFNLVHSSLHCFFDIFLRARTVHFSISMNLLFWILHRLTDILFWLQLCPHIWKKMLHLHQLMNHLIYLIWVRISRAYFNLVRLHPSFFIIPPSSPSSDSCPDPYSFHLPSFFLSFPSSFLLLSLFSSVSFQIREYCFASRGFKMQCNSRQLSAPIKLWSYISFVAFYTCRSSSFDCCAHRTDPLVFSWIAGKSVGKYVIAHAHSLPLLASCSNLLSTSSFPFSYVLLHSWSPRAEEFAQKSDSLRWFVSVSLGRGSLLCHRSLPNRFDESFGWALAAWFDCGWMGIGASKCWTTAASIRTSFLAFSCQSIRFSLFLFASGVSC